MGNITKDLQDTLDQNPQIKEVHFDIKGDHHFNVFPASAIDERTGKRVNAHGLIAGGNGGSIVETLTREEVLSGKASPAKPAKPAKAEKE